MEGLAIFCGKSEDGERLHALVSHFVTAHVHLSVSILNDKKKKKNGKR